MAVDESVYRRLKEAGFSHKAALALADPDDATLGPKLDNGGGGGQGYSLTPVEERDDVVILSYSLDYGVADIFSGNSDLIAPASWDPGNPPTRVSGGVGDNTFVVKTSGLYDLNYEYQFILAEADLGSPPALEVRYGSVLETRDLWLEVVNGTYEAGGAYNFTKSRTLNLQVGDAINPSFDRFGTFPWDPATQSQINLKITATLLMSQPAP